MSEHRERSAAPSNLLTGARNGSTGDVDDRVVPGHAQAAAGVEEPGPGGGAEVRRRLTHGGVRDTRSLDRDDGRRVGAGGDVRERREADGDAGAHLVVDADGEESHAGPLVVEREVDAGGRVEGDAPRLRVDRRVVDVGEDAIGGDDVDGRVGDLVPGRRRRRRRVGVRREVVEAERLLALLQLGGVGEVGTLAYGELHLDVEAVGAGARDPRHPQPVADRRDGHRADGVDAKDVTAGGRVARFTPLYTYIM